MTMPAITLSCDECAIGRGPACADCVVSFIVEHEEPEDEMVIDAGEARALRLFGQAGLVPPLRFTRKAG